MVPIPAREASGQNPDSASPPHGDFLRVLQITPYYPPYIGGQERFVYQLVSHLERRGIDVTVATTDFPPASSGILNGNGSQRYRCIARPLRNPIAPGFFGLLRNLEDFDVVHVHNEHAFPTQIVSLWKLAQEFPLILTCHGLLRFGSPGADFVVGNFDRLLASHILRRADIVVSLSRIEAQRVRKLGVPGEKIRIIPNGIDTRDSAFLSRHEDGFRERYGIGDARVLLTVGPLIERKRPDLAVRAFSKLYELDRALRLLVVGDGSELSACRRLARSLGCKNGTVFTGRVSREDLAQAYSTASCLILPSISEGVPTAILEALLLGTPVVASDLPSIREWFADYVVLAPPGSLSHLSNAIRGVLDGEAAAGGHAPSVVSEIRNRFSWDTITEEYLQLYEQTAN